MSKNTGDTRFRKVDVDKYDTEKFDDEMIDEGNVEGPNESEVTSFLNKYPLNLDLVLGAY